jgi:capsular polysaccharide biosynthesis protein
MEIGDLLAILHRRWWAVVLVPVLVAGLLAWQARTASYQTVVRATVLIPGDTEIPGSAERPELMVLDDLPPLVASRAFAEGVHAALGETALSVEDVHRALSGERYSRIVTVRVTHQSAEQAKVIAGAVARALPDLVNQYLMADASPQPATVRVIDPPGEPARSRPGQALRQIALVLVGCAAGAGLAMVLDVLDPRLSDRRQIERMLGLPVLADLRRK